MSQEHLLALLQRYAVHDGLSLHTFQRRADNPPVAGVNHHRYTADVRFAAYQVQERPHLELSIQQAVVHVYVYHLCTRLHLLACNRQGLVVRTLRYQAQELAAPRHVTALANLVEISCRHRLQPRKRYLAPVCILHRYASFRPSPFALDVTQGPDMLWRRSAAATHYVHQITVQHHPHVLGKPLRRLLVFAHSIRQSRIGVARYVVRSLLLQQTHIVYHVLGTERTVDAHRQYIRMLHAYQESLQRLSAQQSSLAVVYRNREHQRYTDARPLTGNTIRLDGSLAVQCVEYRLQQDAVNTSPQQCPYLFGVRIAQLVKCNAAKLGMLNVRAYAQRLVRRRYRCNHKTRFVLRRSPFRLLARQTHRLAVQLPYIVLQAIVSHRNAVGAERVCSNDVSTGLQVTAVYIPYHVGTRYAQHIVAAHHQRTAHTEAMTPKVLLLQPVRLNHGTHGTVQDQYPALAQLFPYTHITFAKSPI